MQKATYNNRMISLEQTPREDFQKIYWDAKKGEASCPVCGESVRLYLGFQEEPHFYHVTGRTACDIPMDHASDKEPQVQYRELNNFRVPVARPIAESAAKVAYRLSEPLKIKRPFTGKTAAASKTSEEYFRLLEDAGISFDPRQQEAVQCTDGPLLILAGAGSGKTRVLTARTAFMLNEKNVAPESMMLVTFTAKAAAEMKSRLLGYPGTGPAQVNRIVSGTFHSIFYKILLHHDREKWSAPRLLKKDWQRDQILKDAGRKLGLDEKEFAYDLALQQIGLWKNSMLAPMDVRPASPWEEKAARLYEDYEQTKEERGMFDFDDMLLGCHRLLSRESALLENYQNRFQYFLIDEFQDINKVQYELIRMLSAKHQNVCAVGDDDQSIYAFRGSDPSYLLDFEKDFRGAKKITLNQNYRSPHEIVETANSIISANSKRHIKEMEAQYSHDILPLLFYPYDEEEEATMVLTDIQERIKAGARPKDFAILFRTNASSRAIFERLAHSSLPFKLDQEVESFYERYIVKGMLSYFRLSLNEDDSEAVKAILPSLFLKSSIFRDLQAESILNDCSMLEALSHVKTGFAFQEMKLKKLVPIVRSLSSLPPVSAIEKVEKELGYQDFIKKRGSEGNKLEKGSDDLRDLKVVARHFSTIAELSEHAAHMSAMNQEIKRTGKTLTDAIVLSTIHRSKGLEYPNVYILGAVDGSLPHDFALDAHRNGDPLYLEEERRLLYVAVTRAMEKLFISVPANRRGRKANPSRFLPHLSRRKQPQ